MITKIMMILIMSLTMNREVDFYPTTMVVIDVNYEDDVVTVANFNGDEFAFFDCEDWAEGDICSIVMSNNGTKDTIYDDVIITTRYSGWVDCWGYDITTKKSLYFFK